MNKKIHIIGGGTVSHVRSHLALAAIAYGSTAKELKGIFSSAEIMQRNKLDVEMHLTKMAGGHEMETAEDVKQLVDRLIADETTKIIFFNPAIVDFNGHIVGPEHGGTKSGKYADRLDSRRTWEGHPTGYTMFLSPAEKIVKNIRKQRKDITLVAFKTTCGATEQDMFTKGLGLLKEASCNLVLVNDVKTRMNMIVTPEEAAYHVTTNRLKALENLVDMALLRSHLTFTRSTVVSGESVPWDDPRVPTTLRKVVDHCIERGAYKPFRGATVGHFAVKLDSNLFLTSKRKTDFNKLKLMGQGLVLVKTDGPDSVVAYGSKPSVGGQSQRIVFREHPEADCIVHFHCPIKAESTVPVVSQREFECGSHQCGQNTSNGLKRFGNLKAVFLDQHGPNIVFNKSIDPQEVIDFIEVNFDLTGKTGGYMVGK